MWKHKLESTTGSAAEQLSLGRRREARAWRSILADAALLLALILTSSWLVRR